MITVAVAGLVKPAYKETFLRHMAELAETVRAEDGCITYEQNITAADENKLFLYELWENKVKWQAHLATPHMQKHLEEARPWFEWVEMKSYETTEFNLETE